MAFEERDKNLRKGRVCKVEADKARDRKERQEAQNIRRRDPNVLWDNLLTGEVFEDVEIKPAKDYGFEPVEKTF